MADTYTSFPDSVQAFNLKSDISTSTYTNYSTYMSYIASGDLASAATLLASDTALQKAILTADEINTITKTLQSVEDFVLNQIQTYIHEVVVYRGTYSSTAKYTKYNFVNYTVEGVNTTFECMRDDTPIGTPPTNTVYWVGRVIQGAKGESGLGLSYEGNWTSSITYAIDKWVTHNGKWWASLVENINSEPTESNTNWKNISNFTASNLFYDNSISRLTSTVVKDAIDELKNMVDNKSDVGHVHNYAGSSSAGGAATTALQCTGNSATATTAQNALACSGNSATATVASSCSGNSATATTATYAHYDGNGNHIVNTYAPKVSPQFSGTPNVVASTSYNSNMLRNIVFTATDPTAGVATSYANGSLIAVYE